MLKSVTVTIYVPVAFTVGVAVEPPLTIPGPVQLKVAPDVEDDPASATVEFEQVRSFAGPALAFGLIVSSVTYIVSYAIQEDKFGADEAITYVPVASTSGVVVDPPETICPPFNACQEILAPKVPELPASVTEEAVQVKLKSGPALTEISVKFPNENGPA